MLASIHLHDLGLKNFRVLSGSSGMLAALDTITEGRGSNMFLFADQATLTAGNPLDLEWVSGKREVVRLTD
jgi:hypothetical protein